MVSFYGFCKTIIDMDSTVFILFCSRCLFCFLYNEIITLTNINNLSYFRLYVFVKIIKDEEQHLVEERFEIISAKGGCYLPGE